VVSAPDPKGYDVIHHHGGPWPRARAGTACLVRTFHFSVAAKMETYVRMGRIRTLLNPSNYHALAEEHASIRRGGTLIAVSRGLAADLTRIHRLDSGRIRMVPNGANFDPPHEGRAAWRARNGIGPSASVLLTIGRNDYVKGFDLIERAWKDMGPLPRDVTWVTVGGSTPSRDAGRIVTGPVPHSHVIEWIHAADVGAMPSYYEGGGIALLDMLAGGLPVLAHGVGIAPEVVRSGQNGEILPRDVRAWRDALRTSLANPPARVHESIGPEYRWSEIASRVEAIYRDSIMLYCRSCASSS